MTMDELRTHFTQLINDYVDEATARGHLLALVNRSDVPAKAILVELTPFLSGSVNDADSKTIGDIAFHFC
jgi:hypothetical protein